VFAKGGKYANGERKEGTNEGICGYIDRRGMLKGLCMRHNCQTEKKRNSGGEVGKKWEARNILGVEKVQLRKE